MGVTMMPVDKIVVIIASVLGIIFTYWFFFMKKEKPVEVNDTAMIIVNGGYHPSVISLKKGQPTTLIFKRTDENSCLEEVVLSDFKIREQLPLNREVPIIITPQETGKFTYSCGMNMYHGKIIVK